MLLVTTTCAPSIIITRVSHDPRGTGRALAEAEAVAASEARCAEEQPAITTVNTKVQNLI
jgi:hypothetical protein